MIVSTVDPLYPWTESAWFRLGLDEQLPLGRVLLIWHCTHEARPCCLNNAIKRGALDTASSSCLALLCFSVLTIFQRWHSTALAAPAHLVIVLILASTLAGILGIMPSAESGAMSPGRSSGVGTGEVAVAALLHRLLPKHAHMFDLHIVPGTMEAPHGFFRVHAKARRVHVEATSPVELASGVHWWLKHHAGCSMSWDSTGGLQIAINAFDAARLDELEASSSDGGGSDTVMRSVPSTFYQNVVTFSYSCAFWGWER